MASDPLYYPPGALYWAVEKTIYAQYLGDCPNPCRKYHISADLATAGQVAAIALPYLAGKRIFHKVVKSQSLLAKQMAGKQAGKFITVYMPSYVEHRNPQIAELGDLLERAYRQGLAHPGPCIPRSRDYAHVFIETPIDAAGFIYGGAILDPTV